VRRTISGNPLEQPDIRRRKRRGQDDPSDERANAIRIACLVLLDLHPHSVVRQITHVQESLHVQRNAAT